MSARELEVSIEDRPIGRLRENDGLWEFDYAADWVGTPDAFDLSPALKREQRLHSDGSTERPVQWFFDNLLPEEALRGTLAKEARLPAEDAFGLLAYYGRESAGSLVLRDPAISGNAERGLKPLSAAELSQRIANLPNASFSKDAPKKMSLAGAQHKLPVVLDRSQLFEPLPGTPSTHILKPDHLLGNHYPASVMNEYFTMRLAKEVGLTVPDVWHIYVPQPVFIVQRFDRLVPQSALEALRLHVIDTCQLLNRARTFKYSAANLQTLARAVNECREKGLARQQLYRWLVFNLLVGNADNHLKNISFLVDAEGIRVAPAYDLLSTAVYDTRAMADDRATWPETPLTIPLDGANAFADIKRAPLIAAGRALGLTEATAQRQLERLVASVPVTADRLIAEIHRGVESGVAASREPSAAQAYVAGELRMLRTVRHVIIADMARRLS